MSFDKKDTKLYDVKLRNIVDKNMFAMYLEKKQEDGTSTYVVDEGSTWPEEGYTFNKTMSGCIDGDGNKIEEEILTYDEENHIATVDTGITAYCYLYFDLKVSKVLPEYVDDTTKLSTGDGYLVYHDGKGTYGANEAGDNSYRFAGNNPNNYVCLDGNNNGDGVCDTTKLYRVIGWFPKEGDPTKYEMKIIKSEYITADELGGNLSTSKLTQYTIKNDYTPRADVTNAVGFYWSGESSIIWNNWVSSKLNQTLNKEDGNYLISLSAYTNLIENTKWYIGGNTYNNIIVNQSSMKTAYDYELGANKLTTSSSQCIDQSASNVQCTDALLYQTNKVGLMYATEYGYASAPSNWGTKLSSYNNQNNRSENWLYNGVYEWTLSRRADDAYRALNVHNSGYVYGSDVDYSRYGVRPVLVLKSEATIKSGDGSKESPWRINLQSS